MAVAVDGEAKEYGGGRSRNSRYYGVTPLLMIDFSWREAEDWAKFRPKGK